MARGINKVILVGTVGKDPEVRYFQSGDAYCTLSLATSESWKDKNTGEKKEKTEWHRVKFTRRLAEVVGEYVKKGQQIYVEGSLETSKYTDKQGIERYSTDIVGDELQLLGGPGEGGGEAREGGAPRQGGYAPRANTGTGTPAPRAAAPAQRAQPARAAAPPSNDFDDEIPF